MMRGSSTSTAGDGKRVLVTGATGFLGEHAAVHFSSLGMDVVATGRDAKRLKRLEERGVRTMQADLSIGGSVRELVRYARAECVVHCAAKSAPFGPRREFVAANTRATEHLVSASLEAGTDGFVHISTPSLYCDGRALVRVAEHAPLPGRAINAYAETKRAAERRLRDLCAEASMRFIILRPRAIFGPGDTALFPRLVRALEDGKLPVIGGGDNVVDLTYVDNVVLAIERAMGALEDGDSPAHGSVYNITNGEPVPLWDLIQALAERLGLEPPRRRVSRRSARAAAAILETVHRVLRRSGEPLLTRYSVDSLSLDATLDITAARRDLGYEPLISMSEGVERFIAHELRCREVTP